MYTESSQLRSSCELLAVEGRLLSIIVDVFFATTQNVVEARSPTSSPGALP